MKHWKKKEKNWEKNINQNLIMFYLYLWMHLVENILKEK